jgi:hypothetical protein
MPVRIDRLIRFSMVSAMTLAVAATSPAVAQQPEPQTYRSFPYVTLAGDLTGDGLADVMTNEETFEYQVPSVAAFFPTSSIAARKGIDGSALWQREAQADHLLPAPLGPQAANGVLAVDGVITGSVGTGGGSVSGLLDFAHAEQLRGLNLTALNGSGGVVWERAFDEGAFAGAAVLTVDDGRRQVIAARQYPLFVATLQATPSPALDVLVTILDRTEVNDQIEASLTVVIVDGADGSLASSRVLATEGTRPAALAVGDLDGDRLDDVLVVRAPGVGELTAMRGVNGATLWTNDDDVVPFEAYADDLGDVTGDGIEDVAVRGFGDLYDETPPRVTVLDGADGSVLFGTVASSISAVGQVQGSAALLAQYYDEVESEVEYRLFDASGDVVVERYVQFLDDDEDTHVGVIPEVGDLDGDGVFDAGHVVYRQLGTAEAGAERSYVSGRTLSTLVQSTAGIPILASFDGDGDDLLHIQRASASAFAVTAQNGGGSSLWTGSLAVDPAYPGTGRVSVVAANVDGDAVPDLILNAETSRVVETPQGGSSSESVEHAWVLSGADGSILWKV